MKEKSLYNMIISIIGAVIIIPFLVLGIVFSKNTLTIILMSVYYPILMTYYILKSISYGKEESTSKTILYRLSRISLDVATTLITIDILLRIANPTKWISFGIVLLILVFEIIIDAIDKANEVKYLLSAFKAILLTFVIVTLFKINLLVCLAILSIVICYLSNLLGKILQNKLILSYEIISLVLFGTFLILI